MCLGCNKHFQNKSRPQKLQRNIWKKFIYERRIIRQLSHDYGKSINWIRKQLENYNLPIRKEPVPCETVIVADSTFFKRPFGVCVLRADKIKQNIFWRFIDYERAETYRRGRVNIERKGFIITAAVTDGRSGVREVFADVPCQMCHESSNQNT